jgi:hypothetical protein
MTDKPQQWFFLALVALWLILSLLAPLVAFVSTGNLLCLTACADIAPPTYVLYILAKRIFPPGDNETKIKLANLHKKTGDTTVFLDMH